MSTVVTRVLQQAGSSKHSHLDLILPTSIKWILIEVMLHSSILWSLERVPSLFICGFRTSLGASIEIELHVAPYVGHLNLTRNEPLPIIEGRCDFISSQHLHAATDFDNQNPILQYSITGAPEHGHLEIQDQGFWRPVLGPNIAFEGFTQYDVNHNLVRYCHDNHSLETDVFQFQLHSTHLVADSGNFTINVFPYADLQQPTVSLTTRSLSVPEGGQVRLTSNTLTASLLRNVRPPMVPEENTYRAFRDILPSGKSSLVWGNSTQRRELG